MALADRKALASMLERASKKASPTAAGGDSSADDRRAARRAAFQEFRTAKSDDEAFEAFESLFEST